jgi:predicted nucleic acid-binding protein
VSLYLDSSALLKRYLDEPDSDANDQVLASDRVWITGRHTYVEVRRNLHRNLAARDLTLARQNFLSDWDTMHVVELDFETFELAAELAEVTGARTLDSMHLGAASRVGRGGLPFVTYDLRQAQAARSLGWTVLGA